MFTIAKNDKDENVQKAATAALAKLEQMPVEQTATSAAAAKEVKMDAPKQPAQAA